MRVPIELMNMYECAYYTRNTSATKVRNIEATDEEVISSQ